MADGNDGGGVCVEWNSRTCKKNRMKIRGKEQDRARNVA